MATPTLLQAKYVRLNGKGYEFGVVEPATKKLSNAKRGSKNKDPEPTYYKHGVRPTYEDALAANDMAYDGLPRTIGVKA
jgi:hypothetical protein